jgi:hypothetical protein
MLRVLASGSVQLPYRYDERFAGASPELLALIDVGRTAAERAVSEGPRNVVERYELIPGLRQAEAVAAALELDRAGKPPEEALAPVRDLAPGLESRSFVLGQIVTPSGATLRAEAYEMIWRAYRSERLRPDLHPSRALARAALDRWASARREGGAGAEEASVTLVQAYLSLGDEGAATGEAARIAGPTAAVDRQVALGRLDEAVAAFEALQDLRARSPTGQTLIESCSAGLLRAAAMRADLQVRIARARLHAALWSGDDDVGAAGEVEDPLAVVRRRDGAEAMQTWARRFEAVARSGFSARALVASEWAVEAWVRAGRPDRARDVIALWSKRVEKSLVECNDKPICVARPVRRMALWVGDYDLAWSIGAVQPVDFVVFDIQHGRGLANLDAHLDRSRGWAPQVGGALKACVDQAAGERQWAIAKACVLRLAARAEGSGVAGIEQPRTTAISAAFRIAGAAADGGDLSLMREMTSLGLGLAQGGEDAELEFPAARGAEQAAIRQLQADHRLWSPP